MKKFWQDVTAEEAGPGAWRVALDGRPIRTQGGANQVVPSQALAEALAGEWRAQGETIDPRAFVLRDLADYAIDMVAPDRAASIERLLPYAQTDTLCYRADPGTDHLLRQEELWDPLVSAQEQRLDCRFALVSGIIYSPQPEATMQALRKDLASRTVWDLAALETLVPLAASFITGLAALEPGAEAAPLFAAANAEEDWQAEMWGSDAEAEAARAARQGAFSKAVDFAALARSES